MFELIDLNYFIIELSNPFSRLNNSKNQFLAFSIYMRSDQISNLHLHKHIVLENSVANRPPLLVQNYTNTDRIHGQMFSVYCFQCKQWDPSDVNTIQKCLLVSISTIFFFNTSFFNYPCWTKLFIIIILFLSIIIIQTWHDTWM